MKFTRFYSDGTPVESQIRWARFDSKITAADGSVVFEMKDIEAPESWSQGAVDILAQKYFRKAGVPTITNRIEQDVPIWLFPSQPDRISISGSETTARAVFHRLAGCWTYWGWKSKLFSTEEDARIFYNETYLMLARQIAAPNSPQFFNCGLHWAYGIIGPDCGQWAFDESGNIFETHDSYSRPQVHACYIQPLSDDLVNLGGIMDLALREAKVFKHGSGSGSNVSNIRATGEKLSGGGTSSGLISFLRVLDRAAGAIKSGGVTRRAAKMVILDLDHPDIEEFIHWKYNEEQKARALVAAGYSEADALETISGQNANNSVRVPNKFLSAIADKDIQWGLYERTTGKAAKYVKAYDLWTEICRAAWLSGDPGVQFSDTINSWHTCKADGDIIASNPCCLVGSTLVDTSEGKISFENLERMYSSGQKLPHAFGFDLKDRMPILSQIRRVWIAGEAKELVRIITDKGLEFECTSEHRILTRHGKIEAGEWIQAKDLRPGMRLRKIGRLINSLRQDRCTISTRKGDFYQNRYIWEQINGPIPIGYDVHHKDENPMNDRLSNFELVETTTHKSHHFSGNKNPKWIEVPTHQLVEVFEEVEKLKAKRENQKTGACHSNWNRYVRKHFLPGIIPLANSSSGRIRGMEWNEFVDWINENRGTVNHRIVSVEIYKPDIPIKVYDLEVEGSHHNFGISSYDDCGGDSVIVHNSEYLFLDSTACNLASLNLVKFLDSQGTFDTRAFEHAVRIWTAVLDISVTMASYPSREIAEGTWKYRTLGLGYANLGGLLMRKGIPYDSTEGRQIAAQIVAQLQYTAYSTSAEMAVELGAFPRYEANKNHVSNVLAKHDAASRGIVDIHYAVDAKVRNAQVSVTAPTGTIALLMDCDTTGIEPDFSLVKLKKLAGGGEMRIVNQSVPIGLKSLGYTATQIAAILAHIEKTGTVLGMAPRNGDPFIAPEHISVFATAVGENSISPEAHVRMVAAVQPFISGGISKCVLGDTIITTSKGLIRIDSLYNGELPNSFSELSLPIMSTNGIQYSDSFYYGGEKQTIEVRLKTEHKIVGTPNHRLLSCKSGNGLNWNELSNLVPGDFVAIKFGSNMWASNSSEIKGFEPSPLYGNQKVVKIPKHLTADLAFFLGTFASEGNYTESNYTTKITNPELLLLEEVCECIRNVFGVEARIEVPEDRCACIIFPSKTVGELLSYLGCGHSAREKRIPSIVLSSTKEHVLAFLSGLLLDATVTEDGITITSASESLIEDLQIILTNLGIQHSRCTVVNRQIDRPTVYGNEYFALDCAGEQAQNLAKMVRFWESHKLQKAEILLNTDMTSYTNTLDVFPVITGPELFNMLPKGKSGKNGKGTSIRPQWRHLVDPRTKNVSYKTVQELSKIITLPTEIQHLLDANIHFVKVESVKEAGLQKVYDLSVPETHAFLGNGIVSHNTVNMPNSATVEDVDKIYRLAHELGCKSIAIYRDGCKLSQPLSEGIQKPDTDSGFLTKTGIHILSEPDDNDLPSTEKTEFKPTRRRLPKRRFGYTNEYTVDGQKLFLRTGEYDDGTLGEVFVNLSKEGSTARALMEAWAKAVSLGLQFGVPLEKFVNSFTHIRFEPAGIVSGHDQIKMCSSLIDLVMRDLGISYLNRNDLGHVSSTGIEQVPSSIIHPTTVEHYVFDKSLRATLVDVCWECGQPTLIRTGTCLECTNCHANTGCG